MSLKTAEKPLDGNNMARKRRISEPFDWKNVKRIMINNLRQVKENKEIFITMIILPVLMAVMMPIITGVMAVMDPEALVAETGLSPYEAMTEYIIGFTLKPMFLLIPGTLSMMLAADSFAGEKERKTVESLLVLPITHRELFLGKILMSVIPSIFFSIVSFFIMGVEVNIIAGEIIPEGEPLFIFGDLSFWFMAFILSTFLSIFNVQIGVIISVRSKDVKSAQTVMGFLILPLIGFMVFGMVQPALLNNALMILGISAIIGLLVYIMTIVGEKAINRERLIATL
ncbi:MAG: ABC transporter permease subunit [Candidatus Lokiarchaeota archaeon]|nr:ABC transporter permease subunit [Candidatus Lokiarchaeota archaeon]